MPKKKDGRAPIRTRRRNVISCTECHRRKQKCDRELPCSNCKYRRKEPGCVYDPIVPIIPLPRRRRPRRTLRDQAQEEEAIGEMPSIAADWGYAQHGAPTMGFLQAMDTADGRPALSFSERPRDDDLAVREKYKSLIRQLPARIYMDNLIRMYFRGFNWQYYPIDPDIFYQQLEEWNNLPFNVLSSIGPQALSPDLQAFPAVLFQMIGTALLLLPESPDPIFDGLKYAGNMKFEDLAVDYSDSGATIISLLGKKQISLVTVQAQFLRASFLKFTAQVTEAWHTISMAIRDAQELGMHRDSLDPLPEDSSVESRLQNRWLIQRRRKMFALLAVWDLNCALVLGRPGTVDWNQSPPTPPIDAPIPVDRSTMPVIPRDKVRDPPTPITRILWTYELCGPLRDIQNLESDGPCPRDWSRVDRIHQSMLELIERIPPAFRLDNPDTRWDNHPDLEWLQAARYYFAQLHQFGFMALHRPYVLRRKESRSEAIHASLRMLEIQRMTFHGLPPDSWRNFMLFYGSFDAIVLIASVYLLFPHEHAELTGSVSQHFQWTIERFSAIQDRNPLARSAQGVLKAIVARFRKTMAATATATATAPSSERHHSNTPASEGRSEFWATALAPASPVETSEESFVYPQPSFSNVWTMPSMDSLASVAPMFPTSDLIYNDLNASQDGTIFMPSVGEGAMPDGNDYGWQYGSDLGDLDGTIWQLLNQIQPGSNGQAF